MICFFTKHILNPEQLSLHHNRHNNLVDPTYAILVTVIIDFYRWGIRNVGAKWCICHMCWITNRIVLMVRENSARPFISCYRNSPAPLISCGRNSARPLDPGGSCCRNSAAPLISRCRNSAITLDVVQQKFYKTPWFHTAEILQDPLNSCYRNSARPLIACCRNSAAPLIACCRNSAAPDFILLDLMLYKFCSLLIWCWCRRISLSLVTRGRIISRLCCKGYQRLQSFYGTGYHRLQSFLITYYQGLQNFCIMGNHIV